nr:4Fe-4S binding protein [Candidatus Sigynarchaeota archaeon]
MVLVFITWGLLTISGILLMKKSKLTKKKSAIMLAISTIAGGFLFGAVPNPIQPINQLLLAVRGIGVNQTLIPMIVVLVALLLSTLLVGRAFCGYACPLGSLQELLSRFKFKSSINAQRNAKAALFVPEKHARWIRVVLFGIFAIITVTWTTNVPAVGWVEYGLSGGALDKSSALDYGT